MTGSNQLSDKEIWDDSALQNSWNEALQEYNRYHSIHARGEKVEDVLREFEGVNDVTSKTTANLADEITMNDHNDHEVEVEVEEETMAEDYVPVPPPAQSASNIKHTSPQENKDDSKSKPQTSATPPGMPPLPDNLIGAVHDEDLKRLLMSWYYSGYYTGLYEGKQAARETNPTG